MNLPDMFFKNQLIHTSVKINGTFEDVAVEADYQPAEQDTNTPEGVDIHCVWHEDNGNLLDEVAPTDLRELERRILHEFQEYCAGYFEEKADHELQRRKER